MGSVTNHNLLRQYDVMIMIVDDYDAAPQSSKQAGATRELVQKRTSAFAHKKKIIYCSSPQIKNRSNIEEVFLLGDQRYYKVPCPCCSSFIKLEWDIEIDKTERAGITWKLDKNGNVDRKSVGYVCQDCAGFFTDSRKYEMNLAGFWEPSTLTPKEENHWSYQINSLYSPPGMDDWAHYVTQFVAANPEDGKKIEIKNQTFYNVVLGLPYEQESEEIKATELQQNIRPYEIGSVPEKLSLADGNGKIVLITLACDLNGTEDDARLDYEVLAWAESGSNYSVRHGSIGTFIPKEGNNKAIREKLTYRSNQSNSVWPHLNTVLETFWQVDTGRRMKITMSGMDCGFHTKHAYNFLDHTNHPMLGLRGKDLDKATRFAADLPPYKGARERKNLFLVEVNRVKDSLAENIRLKWDARNDEKQPSDFMNYPTPRDGLYLFENYFKHFEAEHRTFENKNGDAIAAMWVKKSSHLQNHFWDVRVYHLVVREIWVEMFGKMIGEKNFTWADYCRIMAGNKK
jgi:phage terminase large subunit GpA-like protein